MSNSETINTKAIKLKCDKYEREFKANPPHVTGHLKGGIATKRMQQLKVQIEKSGWMPSVYALQVAKKKVVLKERFAKDWQKRVQQKEK